MSASPDDPTDLDYELEALSEIYGTSLNIRKSHNLTTVNLSLPLTTEPVHVHASTHTCLVAALPPLKLTLSLPPAYPSIPPRFHISAEYIPDVPLQNVAKHLDAVFVSGEPAIFAYAEALVSYLADAVLVSTSEAPYPHLHLSDTASQSDPCIARAPRSPLSILQRMLPVAQRIAREQLHARCFRCPVCWDIVPGNRCLQLEACLHVACRDCLQGFWQARVDDGRVGPEDLVCAETDCSAPASVAEVRQVLDEQQFDKYERFLLNRALSGPETVTCIRKGCDGVAWRDETDRNLTRCAYCSYVFCANYERSWHQGNCATSETDVREIAESYEHASEEEQKQIREILPLAQWEKVSLVTALRKVDSKMCPDCGTLITKDGGCSHMRCACGCDFCWQCRTKLSDTFQHYRPGVGCYLYQGEAEQSAYEQIWQWIYAEEYV